VRNTLKNTIPSIKLIFNFDLTTADLLKVSANGGSAPSFRRKINKSMLFPSSNKFGGSGHFL
jgi:hypothetical protein